MSTKQSVTAAGQPYEKMSDAVQIKCKPSQKQRWSKLWGFDARELSFHVRRILDAEANKIQGAK